MAERYIPVFLDFNETTQDLTDEECGRLVRAVVRYANGEDTEALLTGAERIAFRFMKGNVDRNIQLSEARAQAGSRGGTVSKPKQTEAKASKPKQTEAKGSKNTTKTKTDTKANTDTKTKAKTDTDTETQPEAGPGTNPETARESNPGSDPKPFLPDGEAEGIRDGHNRVLEAAQDAGFKSSAAERAGLLRLCADYGPEKTLRGIGECVRHSAPTLAYLEAVLKGTGKKKPPSGGGKDDRQRDYTGEQGAAMERMMTLSW